LLIANISQVALAVGGLSNTQPIGNMSSTLLSLAYVVAGMQLHVFCGAV
jgi:hypothetical protein